MSSAIQFLESLGRKSAPSAAEYAAIVSGLEINDAQRRALLDRDHSALSELLDGRATMFCFVATPNDNEQESTPDDKDNDGVPDEDESPFERE